MECEECLAFAVPSLPGPTVVGWGSIRIAGERTIEDGVAGEWGSIKSPRQSEALGIFANSPAFFELKLFFLL